MGGIMRVGLRAGGGRQPSSAASYFMLRGILAGGARGAPLYVGIEFGYLGLIFGGTNLGSGSTATFLLFLFCAVFGFRGLVFGLIIGTLTAAVALLARQRLPIATRSRRVLAVAAVSCFTSGALAWLVGYAAVTFLEVHVVEFVYPVAAAIIGGLVAAITECSFASSARDDQRSVN